MKKRIRSAIDGRFMSEKKANKTDPDTWIKETVKPSKKPPTKKK